MTKHRLLGGIAALAWTAAAGGALAAPGDWPLNNRTLEGDRLAPQTQITPANVAGLKPVCTYDMGLVTSFQTGPILVGRTIYVTSTKDTAAVDAATCKELWHVHEDSAESLLKVNRGVAWADGRVVRGIEDGRVVAYDAKTGKVLWSVTIADAKAGESIPAAPIFWNSLVFIGTAGGDNFAVRGRMYALDAATGRTVWQIDVVPKATTGANPAAGGGNWTSYTLDPKTGVLYIPGGNPAPDFAPDVRPGENLYAGAVLAVDARTGAYRRHFPMVTRDYHDWDVAAAPILIRTAKGRSLVLDTPKDGVLYAFDLADGKRAYATPVTTRLNAEAPLTVEGTRYCPGTRGGGLWSSPAFDPSANLVYSGTVDWCATVKLNDPQGKQTGPGKAWTGSAPPEPFGAIDPKDKWGGWVTAVDADSGQVRWRFKAPAPVVAALTPTATGLLFAADLSGAAYAFDDRTGKVLWQTALDGALGGGIISYEIDGQQRVAFTSGMASPIWPTAKTSAKLVVFGLR